MPLSNSFVSKSSLVAALLLWLPAASQATKAEGPFAIAAAIQGKQAKVTVTSSEAVQNLEMQVYGSDGLEVKDARPEGPLRVKRLRHGPLAPGETWTETVIFKAAEGLVYLNVFVASPGQPPVVRAFAVGTLSDKQKAERQKGIRLDPEGHPIRLMGD